MQKANKHSKTIPSAEGIVNKRSLLSLLSFIFLTVLLYFCLGRPDLLQPQLPQKKLELAYIKDNDSTKDKDGNEKLLSLYTKLKETLARRPSDIVGYSLLVKTCLTLNKYTEARLAQEKVLFLKETASNIEDYALLLDIYLIAAGGRFSIEASKMLKKVKDKYPSNENTHFFLALEYLERKEFQGAIKIYEKLKSQNVLGKEKFILLENKLKKIGYSN
jgi:cytochrome c-type biogenesis protein CcmH/NrfG